MTQSGISLNSDGQDDRALKFVEARLNAYGVETYPGKLPVSLDEAYSIQSDAIEVYPDEVCGWKVGRITGEAETIFQVDRLVGPVFTRVSHDNQDGVLDMPVFADGFTAIEGEVTAVIAKDAPEGKTSYSTEEAREFIDGLYFGVEIASSPFPGINDHGPLVTISDFGNNYGLILGAPIENWQAMKVEDWVFETFINNQSVGRAAPTALPGGPVESVRYLLENTAKRGLYLKKGMRVLTGAVTGVHQAHVGDDAYVILGDQKISVKLSALEV